MFTDPGQFRERITICLKSIRPGNLLRRDDFKVHAILGKPKWFLFGVSKSRNPIKYSQMSGDNITRKLNHVFSEFLIRHSTVKVVYNRNYLINVNRSFFLSKWRLNADCRDWRQNNLESKHSSSFYSVDNSGKVLLFN